MRVAVIRGGRSSEHPVSLRSGAAVAEGLRAAGHETVDVVIEPGGRWVIGADAEGRGGEDVELRAGGGLLGCDVAFPVLHGPFGEDGVVQGLLECLDVPYAGPGVLAAATTIDKLVFKRLLRDAGIAQVDFCAAGDPGWRERVELMGLPVWVKPSRLGSSVGILKVGDAAELDAAVAAAAEHDPRVIIEAHCDGLEVECSVMGNDEVVTSLPGQVATDADWYDYEAKYSAGGMELLVPAPIGGELVAQVRRMAERVYRLLGCTGLARCDFFVTEGGEVLVNELNTIPGFTETSVFAKLFEAGGLPYPQLCDQLVQLAVERHETERGYKF
ncbi:MAG: D-alanine--D-alanine ligase family protein [Solirubrobacterales bacterium]